MKKSSRQSIIYIILLLLLVGALVFVNFENERNKSELFQLKDNIKTHEKLPEEMEIEKRIKSLNNKKDQVTPYLLNKDDPVYFINIIESLAEENELTSFVENAESFRLFEGEDSFGGATILSVSVSGELIDVRNFLSTIENYNKEMSVESIRFSRNELEGSIEWKAFFNVVGKTE